MLITRTGDLRAISAASSAGFLLVFAAGQLANAKLAPVTGEPALAERARSPAVPGSARSHACADGAKQHGRSQLRLVVGLLALPFAYQLVLRWRHRPRPERHAPAIALRRALAKAAMLVGAYLLVAYLALPWAWWLAERGKHPAWKHCRSAPRTPTAFRAIRSMSAWSARRSS